MTWFKSLFGKKSDENQKNEEVVDTNVEINNENTTNQPTEEKVEEPATETTEEPIPDVIEETAAEVEEPVVESTPKTEEATEVRKEE